MSGYLDVMTRKGLKPQVYHGRNNRDFGKKIAKQLIGEDTPVDVLCFNDFVALGMAKVLQSLHSGVSIKRKLLVLMTLRKFATRNHPFRQ